MAPLVRVNTFNRFLRVEVTRGPTFSKKIPETDRVEIIKLQPKLDLEEIIFVHRSPLTPRCVLESISKRVITIRSRARSCGFKPPL